MKKRIRERGAFIPSIFKGLFSTDLRAAKTHMPRAKNLGDESNLSMTTLT